MTSVDEARMMARRLRASMEARGLAIGESDALELVAAQLGHPDWDTAHTLLERGQGAGFAPPIPVLRSLDEAKCRAFYCDFLGFDVEFEHRFEPNTPLYLSLSRGPIRLHLSEHRGDSAPGAAIFVWTTGIDTFRRELEARASFDVPDYVEQGWGRELILIDPFGNRLRFCEGRGD